MSVQLFKDGRWEIFSPESVQGALDSGWCVTKEESIKPPPAPPRKRTPARKPTRKKVVK